MIQGFLALGGVVVGFLLKALFDYIMENRRWAREDRQYFKAKRLDAYSTLIASAQQTVLMSWELHESGKEVEYAELMHQFLSAYQTAYLLASSTTRDAANGLLEAVKQGSPMSGSRPITQEDLSRNHTLLYQRTTLFQNQAQKELGIF